MSMPNSLRAYEDCKGIFERAVQDPKGVRACLGTYESAVNTRTRMHYFRKLDRDANAETYPIGNPMHGQSVYDEYVVQIIVDVDGQYWIYVQPRGANILAIEGLSETDDLIDVADFTEVKTIEHEGQRALEDKSNG